MKRINETWFQAMLEHMKYVRKPGAEGNVNDVITGDAFSNEYRETMAGRDDWVNMLQQMQRDMEEYESTYNDQFPDYAL